jgi:hypothetical protein
LTLSFTYYQVQYHATNCNAYYEFHYKFQYKCTPTPTHTGTHTPEERKKEEKKRGGPAEREAKTERARPTE